MSDSVDRVFAHALQTVRRLPRTGSSRPPPASRLRLYGLYKQSMEGDVESILPRPTLPPSSPDPSNNNNNGSAVHRYASRDLRTRETQAEIEKWDAWHACAGMSRTEAKRRYISTLIETMKVYASGTAESRELVGELEFVWNQIRSQSGSSEDAESPGESPTRRLERSGLRATESYPSIPGGPSRESRTTELARDGGRLRVLSPVSRGGSGEIVEGEDVNLPEAEAEQEEEYHDLREGSDGDNSLDRRRQPENDDYAIRNRKWRQRIEGALTKMTAEIAALREQMEESKVFPRRRSGLIHWIRWLAWATLRQVLVNLGLVLLLVLWGRWKGDRRAEEWVRRRWKGLRALLDTLDLRQRIGMPSFVTRRLAST